MIKRDVNKCERDLVLVSREKKNAKGNVCCFILRKARRKVSFFMRLTVEEFMSRVTDFRNLRSGGVVSVEWEL